MLRPSQRPRCLGLIRALSNIGRLDRETAQVYESRGQPEHARVLQSIRFERRECADQIHNQGFSILQVEGKCLLKHAVIKCFNRIELYIVEVHGWGSALWGKRETHIWLGTWGIGAAGPEIGCWDQPEQPSLLIQHEYCSRRSQIVESIATRIT